MNVRWLWAALLALALAVNAASFGPIRPVRHPEAPTGEYHEAADPDEPIPGKK